MVLGLCERFGCLPSALFEESAELAQMLNIEALGGSRDSEQYSRDHHFG